jgi:hypothetical protein
MEKTTISLAGTKVLDKDSLYLVDFSKLDNVNDLVLILSCMGISFAGSHPHVDKVKQFLNLDNPIKIQGQPQQKEMSLPKLKQL